MVQLSAHICSSEDIQVRFVVSLRYSVESRAVNQHICRGGIGGQQGRLKEL